MQPDPAPGVEPSRSAAKPVRRLNVSRSLQIFAMVICLGLLGRTAYQLMNMRTLTLEAARHQLAQLDMVLAEQASRAMETADFIMQDAARDFGGIPATLTQEDLQRRIANIRQLQAIEITDAEGRIVRSSRADEEANPGMSLPQAGLDLLQPARASPDPGMLISMPIRALNGSWTALAARRLPGPDFRGLVVGVIDLGYFEGFYKAVELDESGAIQLHRRDGIVLARSPHREDVIGTSFADRPPFRDVLSHDTAGTMLTTNRLDATRHIVAIRALRSFPLAVNVSVDQSSVLANWRRQTWIFLVAAMAAALVLGLLLFQLARRSREVEALLASSHEAREAAETAHRDVLVQMEERERAEQALRQAQRVEAVGQLTGGVAHDFNNLLTVVLGNIELMQGNAAAAPFNTRLATMRAAAERGATLTGQLLAFARRQPLMPRSIDLNRLITDMMPLLQSAVGSLITLVLELDPKVPAVQIDPTQIELVILNLSINARDAMPNGGTLRLRTSVRPPPEGEPSEGSRGTGRPDDLYACLSVEDSGAGMTADVLSHAFEPFFTTKGPGAGSGLGLSQVYGVARQSGGTARIESTPGVGTTVHVFLPLTGTPPPAPPPRPASTTKLSSRATLLVVDDDSDVRSTTALLLRRMGYTVIEAESAHEALILIAATPSIDLVLTDVVMPEVNGPELARRAQRMRPSLPVVFFSGYAEPEALAGTFPLSRLLRKPFRPAELAALVESGLSDAVPVG